MLIIFCAVIWLFNQISPKGEHLLLQGCVCFQTKVFYNKQVTIAQFIKSSYEFLQWSEAQVKQHAIPAMWELCFEFYIALKQAELLWYDLAATTISLVLTANTFNHSSHIRLLNLIPSLMLLLQAIFCHSLDHIIFR